MRLRLEALCRDVSPVYIYGTAASAFQSITECHKTWQFAANVSTAKCPPFCVKQQTRGQHATFIAADCAIPQCRLQPFTLQNTTSYAAECGLLQHKTRLNATHLCAKSTQNTAFCTIYSHKKLHSLPCGKHKSLSACTLRLHAFYDVIYAQEICFSK